MNVNKLPKYLANQLNRLTFPVIIKFDEKYDFIHYAGDKNELGKVFVKVLNSRLDDWFYEDEISINDTPPTPKQIEKLPSPYKEDALKKQKRYIQRLAEVAENNRIYNLAQEASNEQNSEKAWECIHSHVDSEYGYYEIISVMDLRVV